MLGTFAWFLVVAYLSVRGRRVLQDKSVWIARSAAVLVIASGLYSLGSVLVGA